jgi:hypothetical protein
LSPPSECGDEPMRLLTKVHASGERAELAAFLESHGIPVFVDSAWTWRASSRGSVFVCLDRQYDDALALLRNPDHDVAEPIDVAEFWKAAPATLPIILKHALEVLAVLIVLVLFVIAAKQLG